MLTALHCQMDAMLLQDGINALKGSLGGLHGGAFANSFSNHLTGRTANHEETAGSQICLFQKFRHNSLCLLRNFFIHNRSAFPPHRFNEFYLTPNWPEIKCQFLNINYGQKLFGHVTGAVL
jgi:hypothetical protein